MAPGEVSVFLEDVGEAGGFGTVALAGVVDDPAAFEEDAPMLLEAELYAATDVADAFDPAVPLAAAAEEDVGGDAPGGAGDGGFAVFAASYVFGVFAVAGGD